MVPQELINDIVDNDAVLEWSHVPKTELTALSHMQLLEDVYYQWILSVRVFLKAAVHPTLKDRPALELIADVMQHSGPFKKKHGISGEVTGDDAERHLDKFAEWLNAQEEETYFAVLEAQREHLRYLFNPELRKDLKKSYVQLNKEVKDKIDAAKDLLWASHKELDELKVKYAKDPRMEDLRKKGLKVVFGRDKDSFFTKNMGITAMRRHAAVRAHFSTDPFRELALLAFIHAVERFETERDKSVKKKEDEVAAARKTYEQFEQGIKGTRWERFRGIYTATLTKYNDLNKRRLELQKELLEHGADISKNLKEWEGEIGALAKAHATLMGDEGPKLQIELELDAIRTELRSGSVTEQKRAELTGQQSYGQHIAWGLDREQEHLALRLIILEQFIAISVELLAGEISSQFDLTLLKKISDQQLDLISKIPKLPKALNVYCSCYTFNFDLVLQFGRLVTDLGKTNYGDYESHGKRAKVVGWIEQSVIGVRTPIIDDIMPGEKLRMTKQYSTGTLTLQLTVGLYFGYGDPDSINVKAGCCMVYTATMSHTNERKFTVSHKLEIKGAASAQFTSACSAELKVTLLTIETAHQFTDVFHWAAWLCHRWARLAALYTAWCNVVDPSTLESDRFGTMTEADRDMLLSAAQQIFADNKKIKTTIERVSQLLTEEPHVIYTQAVNALSDVSAGFGVTVPSPWKKTEDSKGEKTASGMKVFGADVSIPLIPQKTEYYTYKYEQEKHKLDGQEVMVKKAVELRKDVWTVKVQGALTVLGWGVAVSYEHTMPPNKLFTLKGERGVEVAIDLDSLFAGDPFGLGDKLGEYIAKWPSEVLFAIPGVLGVAGIVCSGVLGGLVGAKKETKTAKILTATTMGGMVGSAGGLLVFTKPGTGQSIGGAFGEDTIKSIGSAGVGIVETIVQVLIGTIVSKLFGAKGAKSPIHLFGIPEVPEEALKDISKKYANSIDLPLGLWQCRLVHSKLDFDKLPVELRPTEVMWASVPVLAYWRKYSMSGREFSAPAKATTIPIPSPAGPFFIKIDLGVKLSLERQFCERLEHNTFQYVQSIYAGLIVRHCKEKQRPEAAGGAALWAEFVKDHQRNLFLLCLYTGCKDMGYQNTVKDNKYGSRVYYEVLIDRYSKIAGADAFLSDCIAMHDHCFKKHADLVGRFQYKHLSLKNVDDLLETAGAKYDSCLKTMQQYLHGKFVDAQVEDEKSWHPTSKVGPAFHFTTNPVKLVKRIARYAGASGERAMQALGDDISSHKDKDPVRKAFKSIFDVRDVKKQVKGLTEESRQQLGLGKGAMTEDELAKFVEKHGGAEGVLHQISILKAFQGDNYLLLVSQRIQEGAQTPMMDAQRYLEVTGQGKVKATKTGKFGSQRILGNYNGEKRTSLVWDRTDFYKESGKTTSVLDKRPAKLKAIDEELDKYHSIAWDKGNLDERIGCLNGMIAMVHDFFTSEPKTKRKEALLTFTEQLCDEIGVFESCRRKDNPVPKKV